MGFFDGIGGALVGGALNLFGAGALPVNLLMPDIKVADFFSGILKMFNLTCYSEDGGAFTIQPLAEWYADGSKVNITRFCETNWDVNKTPSYKSFIFKYEKSVTSYTCRDIICTTISKISSIT